MITTTIFLNDSSTGNHLSETNTHFYLAKLSVCRFSSTDELKFDNDGQKPSTTQKRYKKPDGAYLIVTARCLLKCETILSMDSQHNNDIAVGLKDTSGKAILHLFEHYQTARNFNYAFCMGMKKGHSKVFRDQIWYE